MRFVFPLFEGFTTLDVIGPYEVFRSLPGASVTFAAAEPGPVYDGNGTAALTADTAFADVTGADVLVVPGGPGARRRLDDRPLLDWLRALHAGTAWTTSVCTGSLLLAAAGLLDGRTATTHWTAVKTLESYGATYTADRVVVHEADRLVTAAGVSAGIDMALTLAARLADPVTAQAVQLMIEYDPQPPFDAGSPAKAPQAVHDLLAARR
jgi:putative intracellular protease/amidase